MIVSAIELRLGIERNCSHLLALSCGSCYGPSQLLCGAIVIIRVWSFLSALVSGLSNHHSRSMISGMWVDHRFVLAMQLLDMVGRTSGGRGCG